jgi:hypothetical protein
MKPGEERHWSPTERTARRQETGGSTERLFDLNIDPLPRAAQAAQCAAPARDETIAVMRHLVLSPLTEARLSFSVSARGTQGASVAGTSAAHQGSAVRAPLKLTGPASFLVNLGPRTAELRARNINLLLASGPQTASLLRI